MSEYVNPHSKKTFSSTQTGSNAPSIGDRNILQKKLLINPRYAHVQPTIKSGTHAGNLKIRPDRSNEIFKRVSKRTLHNLLLAHEELDESVFALREDGDQSTITMSTVNAFEGEIKAGTADDPSFLLLDVRDAEDYAVCHIESAVNFPSVCIRRDKFTPEIYKFKNAKARVIIIYDFDELSKIGSETVVQFIQKGFDNVVLLTGGIKLFAAKYPSRIIGEIPGEKIKVKSNKSFSGSIGASSSSASSSSRMGPKSPESIRSGISLRTANKGGESGGRESPRENLRARQFASNRQTQANSNSNDSF